MRKEVLLLIATQFWKSAFKSKAIYILIGLMAVLLFFAARSGVGYHDQNHLREQHQQLARESWEGNPDKHPHRMAHFGTFAFRLKHPLSIFDFGIESFTGNTVFLEAHRQNTVNFSEATFSTSLIRFGELSMAMILQIILPLMIFFIGYAAISGDRENGTLRILLTQGASWRELLFGKSLGLFGIALVFFLPFFLTILLLLLLEAHISMDDWVRLLLLFGMYTCYFATLSMLTIVISVSSRSSKSALVKLLGIWLLFMVVLPRMAQSIGTYLNPTPTKLAFRSAIEEEVIQYGDSHDPNDPYYKSVRDSVLLAHGVDSVSKLPFNYGGFQMYLGEKISAEVYRKHLDRLWERYQKQNQLVKWLALVNPYLSVKNTSMALCGTDLSSYEDFQREAESYRYQMAQAMNTLQMKYIKANVNSSEGRVNVVDRKEWEAFPDFSYEYAAVGLTLRKETISIVATLLWLFIAVGLVQYQSKKASAL